MTFREIRRVIRDDGWYIVRQQGSHEQYRHPEKRTRITIAGHDSKDVPKGTLSQILRQAQIR